MSKAEQLVSRMLESGPDDVDPKSDLMNITPEMGHWLIRNGFKLSICKDWYHKHADGRDFNLRPPGNPVWQDKWTFFCTHHDVRYDLTEDEIKRILIQMGVAEL